MEIRQSKYRLPKGGIFFVIGIAFLLSVFGLGVYHFRSSLVGQPEGSSYLAISQSSIAQAVDGSGYINFEAGGGQIR